MFRFFIRSFCRSSQGGLLMNLRSNIANSSTMEVAEEHILNIRKYMSLRQYVFAELEIRRAEALQLTTAQQKDIYFIRGQMELDKVQPNFATAIQYFDKAVDDNKYKIKASLLKVECLLELSKLGQYMTEVDKQIDQKQARPNQLVERAYGLYLNSQYSQALKMYDKCLEAGLNDQPEIYEHRAICSLALNDHANAEANFMKHHELAPKNTQTVAYLASLLWLQGKYDKIMELCQQVIKIDPSEVFAQRFKGMCQYMVGDFEGSVKSLTRTIDMQETPESYYYRAKAKIKLGREGALADLERMLQLEPTNVNQVVDACSIIGDEYLQRNNSERALQFYKKGLMYDPQNKIINSKVQQHKRNKPKDVDGKDSKN